MAYEITVSLNRRCDEGLPGTSRVNQRSHLTRTILAAVVEDHKLVKWRWTFPKMIRLGRVVVKSPTYALKLVMTAETVPSAAAAMGVDVSMVVAGSILPHSLAVDGLCTSLRAGVPATPRAGATAA